MSNVTIVLFSGKRSFNLQRQYSKRISAAVATLRGVLANGTVYLEQHFYGGPTRITGEVIKRRRGALVDLRLCVRAFDGLDLSGDHANFLR